MQGEGRAGHRPRPLPGPAPRRSDRGRPGGRRAGCIPILGVAGTGAGEWRGRPELGGRSARPAMATTSTTGSTLLQPLSNAVQLPIDQVPAAALLASRPRRPLPGRVPSAREPGAGARAGEGATLLLLSARCLGPAAPPGRAHPAPTPPPRRPALVRVARGGLRASTCARACLALLPATAAPRPGACVHRAGGNPESRSRFQGVRAWV